MATNSNEPERPRAEPEIMPPDRSGGPDEAGRAGRRRLTAIAQGAGGTQRIFVTRIGPLGFGLFMLVAAFSPLCCCCS